LKECGEGAAITFRMGQARNDWKTTRRGFLKKKKRKGMETSRHQENSNRLKRKKKKKIGVTQGSLCKGRRISPQARRPKGKGDMAVCPESGEVSTTAKKVAQNGATEQEIRKREEYAMTNRDIK